MGFILGIDDAGRGPVVGPMILAGVVVEEKYEAELKKLGVKDSKLIVHSTRERLAKQIAEIAEVIEIEITSPAEIDEAVMSTSGMNLNKLEAIKMASIVNKALKDRPGKVYIDCPSTNILSWKNYLLEHIEHKNKEFIVEHKADFKYPVVSAASIIAKVTRENEVTKIKKEHNTDFGSGYPADPNTVKWLKEESQKHKDKGIIRKSWQTYKDLFGDDAPKQKRLF